MINNVVLVGRLTRDPELIKTNSGQNLCRFSLALTRTYSREQKTDFINCVAWNKTAELVTQYLLKGSLVGIQGSIQTDRYTAKDGTNRTSFDVVCNSVQFLDSKKEGTKVPKKVADELVNLDEDLGKTTHDISDDDLPW